MDVLDIEDGELKMVAPNVYKIESNRTENLWRIHHSTFKGRAPIITANIEGSTIDVVPTIQSDTEIEVYWFKDDSVSADTIGLRTLILQFQ